MKKPPLNSKNPWSRIGLKSGAIMVMGLLTIPYGMSLAQEVEPLPKSLRQSNFLIGNTLVPAVVTEPDGTTHSSLSPDLDKFIQKNPDGSLKWKQAVKLGKSLFWDQQVGSDGQACASCHFHAGADNRTRNQLNPGLLAGDVDFTSPTHSGGVGGVDYTLVMGDYPFTQWSNPTGPETGGSDAGVMVKDSNDVTSSQGVMKRKMNNGGGTMVFNPINGTNPGGTIVVTQEDVCEQEVDDVWHVGGVNVRRVEPRNTPTVYNSALNFDNFWDGRAKWTFNGQSPIGRRDVGAVVHVGNPAVPVDLRDIASDMLHPGSAASQITGPPTSAFEMSCADRTLQQIGRKMMNSGLQPLGLQEIHPNDSVFAGMIDGDGKGLATTYKAMIEDVFLPEYWSDPNDLGDGYTQFEKNFAFFWGIASMIYESTLTSEQTPFDLWAEAGYPSSGLGKFGPDEIAGLNVFMNKGKCINCHATAMFTKASVLHLASEDEEEGLVERMRMNDDDIALYDNGFYNIGTRPTSEDIGRGGKEADQDLSFTRQWIDILLGKNVPDPFQVNPCSFEEPFAADGSDFPVAQGLGHFQVIACPGDPEEGIPGFDTALPLVPSDFAGTPAEITALENEIKSFRTAVDGAMKVPGLRNVELTGPYWHNGGQGTLRHVVEFYNRGGDFRNNSELDPDINVLNLTTQEVDNLVKFMKALTDERVRQDSGPYSHPQLMVAHGTTDPYAFNEVPAIGAGGRVAVGLPPWRPFLAQPGDIDGDGDVDTNDINYIFIAMFTGQLGPTNILLDYRDDNGDGSITYADVISVSGKCTVPTCAPQ